MQSGTQIPSLLYFLQDRHWFGPGPQQPSEEQRGSHVRPLPTAGTFKIEVISLPTWTKPLLICCILTTFTFGPVVLDFDVFLTALRAEPEQARPIDSVLVAQPCVILDVHAAVVYFPERPQPQRGQRGVPHHQEGVATEHQPAKQHTVTQFWRKGASPLSVISTKTSKESSTITN